MKYILSFFALLLIGAGCAGVGSRVQDSDWSLSFDLPNDWVMVRSYSEAGHELDPESAIDPSQTEVFVQSTDKHIFTTDTLPSNIEEYTSYVDTDYVKISVLKLDARRVVPSEAESVGGDLYKESDTVYYFKGKDNNYKFTIYVEGHELTEAVDVLKTVKEVR